jgi:hypothetical protein
VHVAASTYFVMNDAEVNFDQSIFQGFIDFERLYELVVGVVHDQRLNSVIVGNFVESVDYIFWYGPSFSVFVKLAFIYEWYYQ